MHDVLVGSLQQRHVIWVNAGREVLVLGGYQSVKQLFLDDLCLFILGWGEFLGGLDAQQVVYLRLRQGVFFPDHLERAAVAFGPVDERASCGCYGSC